MFRKVQEIVRRSRHIESRPSNPEMDPIRVADAATPSHKARRALASGLMRGLFSQLGEDGTILWIFEGRKNGFYVDIGCHNPLIYSNTAALHLWHDWKGLNVDIDKRAIALFEDWRPGDINVLAGVGKEAGVCDAFIFEAGALSTLDVEAASNPMYESIGRERVQVEIMPLRQLLSKYLPADQHIDFLNIDAEGLDYEILLSNDWERYRPDVLAIEAPALDLINASSDRTFQFLNSIDYRLVSHTVITSIYRSRL